MVKHAETDEAYLAARTECTEEDRFAIEVTDEGAGFAPEVFESGDGGGYGLSHMHDRLRFLGGRLYLDSAPGEGIRATAVPPSGLNG